ncbi:MAG: GxxExxY protein [Actinomycetota bacterium]
MGLIEKIKDLAVDIYDELGSGYDEAIYQKAFEVALRLEGIGYEDQRVVPIFYRGHYVGEGKPDIVVGKGGEKLVIELKALASSIGPKEETQLKNYMRVLNIGKGLLINFPQPGAKGTPEKPEVKEVSLE